LLAAVFFSFLNSLFLLQIFAGILFILWLFEKNGSKKKAFDIFSLLIVIFGLVRVASILLSDYPEESYQSFYKEALFYCSFFAMQFYFKAFDSDKLLNISHLYVVAAVLTAFIGLILFNFYIFINQFINIGIVYRTRSFSSGYMAFSSYLLTGLGLFVGVPHLIKRKWDWIAVAAGISIILSALITSLGRTNIVISFLILLFGIAIKKINFKQIILIIIFTTGLTLISFYNNYETFEVRVEKPVLLSDRDILLKGAKEKFLEFENPIFGYGPRTFRNVFPFLNEMQDKKAGSWHNDFIQIYFDSGVLGLAAFLTLLAFIFIKGIKNFRTSNNKAIKNNILGIIIAAAALVLSSLTSGFITSPVLSIVFAFMLAYLSGLIELGKSSSSESKIS